MECVSDQSGGAEGVNMCSQSNDVADGDWHDAKCTHASNNPLPACNAADMSVDRAQAIATCTGTSTEMQACTGSATEVTAACSGTATTIATTIAASCTGDDDGAGSPCALNSEQTNCEVESESCTFTSATTPTCDLDAATDGTAACPDGCTATAESTPTCDLLLPQCDTRC